MKCIHCFKGDTVKAHLVLFTGLKLLVRYCPVCEGIQRIGDSVPDVGDKYKGYASGRRQCRPKGGDAQ